MKQLSYLDDGGGSYKNLHVIKLQRIKDTYTNTCKTDEI